MKRVFNDEQSFTIENKAKKLTRSKAKNVRGSSAWPPWFQPGTYCGADPAILLNSGVQQCAQPNYPALWSYRYGLAPVRNWFVSNIQYGYNLSDETGVYVHPADPDENPNDSGPPDAFNSAQCGGSSLGSSIVKTQSLLRAQNEPYWVAIISFFIALFFYGEKTKPKIPIVGDRYPALALALFAFVSSYIGTWFKYNFWYPFVSSWLDLFSISTATQENYIMGPTLNTYFSFVIAEITDNGPTAIDSAAITLISTLFKEQVIDSVGDFVYDSVYGNQPISAPDGTSTGVDVNGINCATTPDAPPIIPLISPCGILGPDGKMRDGCNSQEWGPNPGLWSSNYIGPGKVYPSFTNPDESTCLSTAAGKLFGCYKGLPNPFNGTVEWYPKPPPNYYNAEDADPSNPAVNMIWLQCADQC